MNIQEAAIEFRRMHDTRTVRRASIVAWYCLYKRHLPEMHPWRSDADLIRTTLLWMHLSDRGGQPGFPFDYSSELQLDYDYFVGSVRPSRLWLVSVGVAMVGLIWLFINWKMALIVVGAGIVLNIGSYYLAGAAASPLSVLREDAERVLEWDRNHRADAQTTSDARRR